MIHRPNSFTVGRMRYRVNLQKRVDVVDEQGQPVTSWTNYATSWPADFEETRGGQMFRGGQVQEGVTAIFTMRQNDEMGTQDRIVFRGENYGVVWINPVGGRDRYAIVHAKVVK
jgi:SPP1 family predicted phage head-tail adaptor